MSGIRGTIMAQGLFLQVLSGMVAALACFRWWVLLV